MPIIYLSHPIRGGVHIAYDDDEVRRCEADGWVSHGTTHPAAGGRPQAPAMERLMQFATPQPAAADTYRR